MRKLLPLITMVLLGCSTPEKKGDTYPLLTGPEYPWRAVLNISGQQLPFNFHLLQKDAGLSAVLINGDEMLQVDDVQMRNDSIFIPGYIFESEIRAKIVSDSVLEGLYVRLDTKEPYEIPFTAKGGRSYRFTQQPQAPTLDAEGKWEVTFVYEQDTSKAIGLFEQQDNRVTGTFLTPVGDYRFLEGTVSGDSLMLSCFDGTHAFLFKAAATNQGALSGEFWSGKHWNEQWTAVRNDSFTLPSADTLTYLKEGYDRFTFAFPDSESGHTISSEDERFQNKVTIVQIMGSWCPNCMDETIFLTQLQQQFPDVEVVALAFERSDDFEVASRRVNKVKTRLGAPYPFLIAGTSDKAEAAKALPMLNHVLSYPTAVMIDKTGKVRHIHTGFSGPGTGEAYQRFSEKYVQTLERLLSE